MLIPEISRVGARTSNSGRREPAANARRATALTAPPTQAEPTAFDAGENLEADDLTTAAPQQGTTLAGALAAYAAY